MTDPEIERAITALGRSKHRLEVFAGIYSGRKDTKTVSDLVGTTGLESKQVLTCGKELARDDLVEQVKKDGQTAYKKLGAIARHKERILKYAARPRAARPAVSRTSSRAPTVADVERPSIPVCRRRPINAFDCSSLHPQVSEVCRRLYGDGHYAQAVTEALKLYNNCVKEKAGRPTDQKGRELDGASLMTTVFSPSSPVLCINPMQTTSEKDEQTGYMLLAQGAMTGLRNPRAHEHGVKDDPERARELTGLVSYLMRRLDGAKKTRR